MVNSQFLFKSGNRQSVFLFQNQFVGIQYFTHSVHGRESSTVVGERGGEIFGRVDNLSKQCDIRNKKFRSERTAGTHDMDTAKHQNNHHQSNAHELTQRRSQVHLTVNDPLDFGITLITRLKRLFCLCECIKRLNNTQTRQSLFHMGQQVTQKLLGMFGMVSQ